MSLRSMLEKNGYTPSGAADATDANISQPDNTGAAAAGGEEGSDGAAAAGENTDNTNTGTDNANAGGADTSADDDAAEEARALAYLSKKKGIAITSLDDLTTATKPAEPTDAEKEAAEKERRNQIRIFGLKAGKVTTTVLDEYARESARTPAELAFEAWKEEHYGNVAADQMPAAEDLVDEFNDEYAQFADEDDPKRIRKEKELKKLADNYLASKYSDVMGLDEAFEAEQTTAQQRTSYSTNLEQAISEIGNKLSISVGKGKDAVTYDYVLTPEVISATKQAFTSDDSFNVFGKTGLSKEHLVNAIKANLQTNHLQAIISYVAETHANNAVLARAKGRRGIPAQEMMPGHHQQQTSTGTANMQRHLQNNKHIVGAKKN